MPQASHSVMVRAPLERLWGLLLDKIERPQDYLPEVREVEILERQPGYLLRRMRVAEMELVERVTVFEKRHEVDYVLVDHPVYAGQVVNRIEELYETEEPGLPLRLTFALDWRRKDGKPDEEDLGAAIRQAVERTKALAEAA